MFILLTVNIMSHTDEKLLLSSELTDVAFSSTFNLYMSSAGNSWMNVEW